MFIIHTLLDDSRSRALRRTLALRGVFVCDLQPPEEDQPEHQRWLTGTFATSTVVTALKKAQAPILLVEKAHPTAVTGDEDCELMSREEEIDRFGAERVCSTESFQGSLMLAMAANELSLIAPRKLPLSDHYPDALVEEVIQRLSLQNNQWVSSSI